MRISKKIYQAVSGFLLGTCFLLLTSCGGGKPKNGFTFIIPSDVHFSQFYKGATKEYLKQNLQLDITLIEGDHITFTRLLAAGTQVDLVYANVLPFEHVKSGKMKPFDSLIKNDTVYNKMEIYERIKQETSLNNNTWCVSMGCSPVVLFYNKEIFQRSGVPFPDNTWNWDTQFQSSLRLKSRSYIPILLYIGGWHRTTMYIWQNDAEFYDYVEEKYQFDNKNVIEAFEYQLKFYKNGLVPTQAELESSGDVFGTGKVAMYPTSSFYILRALRDKKTASYGIAPLPQGKKRANYLVSANLWLVEGTKYSEDIWKYIKYLLNERNQYRFYTSTSALSVRKSVNARILKELETRYNTVDFSPLTNSIESAKATYFITKGLKVAEYLTQAVDDMTMNDVPAGHALRKLNTEINKD